MKNNKFVAIDIDGTLLDDHDHYDVARLNRDVVALEEKGVHFIVASGNSYDALQAIFKDSPAVKDFVAENGGRLITNHHDILSYCHQRATLTKLLAFVNELPHPDLLSVSGQSKTFIAAEYQGVPVPYYPHHTYFSTLADVGEPVYNLNISWFNQRLPQPQIQAIVDRLNNRFAGEVQATYSGAFGIDILPAGVNKAVGLRQLVTDQLNGSMDAVVAFGDTSNDIEMLQEVGTGYAMKNATSDLLAVADRVTALDNNHDGLLNEIELLFDL
jgi:Cof subfamily protein (haloacid dehalogenase superfamily)